MDLDCAAAAVNEEHLQVKETDDFCRLEFIEIVPIATETDDSCRFELIEIVLLTRDTHAAEFVSENWCADNVSVVKQEPDDVCCIIFMLCSISHIENKFFMSTAVQRFNFSSSLNNTPCLIDVGHCVNCSHQSTHLA